mmetsp:Transcript_119496/g.381291  ORF Transcript_119496/g.381291 Transcript_119496/m.381291 type:complete len:296 (+) Transcript_119496:86-973(+)
MAFTTRRRPRAPRDTSQGNPWEFQASPSHLGGGRILLEILRKVVRGIVRHHLADLDEALRQTRDHVLHQVFAYRRVPQLLVLLEVLRDDGHSLGLSPGLRLLDCTLPLQIGPGCRGFVLCFPKCFPLRQDLRGDLCLGRQVVERSAFAFHVDARAFEQVLIVFAGNWQVHHTALRDILEEVGQTVHTIGQVGLEVVVHLVPELVRLVLAVRLHVAALAEAARRLGDDDEGGADVLVELPGVLLALQLLAILLVGGRRLFALLPRNLDVETEQPLHLGEAHGASVEDVAAVAADTR